MIKTLAVAPGQEPIHVEMTQEETDARTAEEAAFTASASQRNIIAQIKEFESLITPRRMREAVLDIENPANWLSDKETEIAALRAQLT